MQIVVLTSESLKEELLNGTVQKELEIAWVSEVQQFLNYPDAFAFVDLLFENHSSHLQVLQKLLPALIIINSVEYTLEETHPSFVRINGWNTFLKGTVIEACGAESQRHKAEAVLALFGKQPEWLPDEPGFITPRIIGSIINEAYHSLEEGVSSRDQINTAMKLGTNYPFGPFEWAEKIGEHRLSSLLTRLAQKQERYRPSSLLTR